MARLAINWRTLTAVAPASVTTGETADAETAKAMQAEKPMMIYITSDDPTDSTTRKLEDVVFANEKLGIGTKFFDTIKVSSGNALTDRILKDTGRHTPRIVLLTRDYKEHKSLQGKQLSAGKLLKAMSSLVRKEYVNSFEKMCRDYTKLLNDLDRLESKRAKLSSDRARLEAKPSASKEKKLARDEKEFEGEMEKWNEREKKILEFRMKGDKRPEA